MDKQLVSSLAAMLGEKTRVEGAMLHAIIRQGDSWLSTRVRTDPVAEVFVAMRPLDGLSLSIRCGDRWRDPTVGDDPFDNTFGLVANDLALMRAWLDATSRAALLASAYSYETVDAFTGVVSRNARTWNYDVGHDQLIVSKGAREANPERFMRAVVAGCTLAARSQRWASEYADIAGQIGGSAASDVAIGGAPVISVTRAGIDVTVRLVRTGFGADRLRTLATAPRLGREGTLSIANDDLPMASRPELPDGDRHRFELGDYRLRVSNESMASKIDDLAKKLVTLAQPAAIVVDVDSVDVWFDGAPVDHARLDAAVALAAHLAVDAVAAQGPYR